MVATEGIPPHPVRIVAVGSSHGDDQVAWKVVERLLLKPVPGVAAIAVREPFGVLNYLEGCQALVIVDACRSGAQPGNVVRLVWPECPHSIHRGCSTHGFGVVAVLELAGRLYRLPPAVTLIGIEIETCLPAAGLSPTMRYALPKLYRRVLAEARAQIRRIELLARK